MLQTIEIYWSTWSRIRNAYYLRDISNMHVADTCVHTQRMLKLADFPLSKNKMSISQKLEPILRNGCHFRTQRPKLPGNHWNIFCTWKHFFLLASESFVRHNALHQWMLSSNRGSRQRHLTRTAIFFAIFCLIFLLCTVISRIPELLFVCVLEYVFVCVTAQGLTECSVMTVAFPCHHQLGRFRFLLRQCSCWLLRTLFCQLPRLSNELAFLKAVSINTSNLFHQTLRHGKNQNVIVWNQIRVLHFEKTARCWFKISFFNNYRKDIQICRQNILPAFLIFVRRIYWRHSATRAFRASLGWRSSGHSGQGVKHKRTRQQKVEELSKFRPSTSNGFLSSSWSHFWLASFLVIRVSHEREKGCPFGLPHVCDHSGCSTRFQALTWTEVLHQFVVNQAGLKTLSTLLAFRLRYA